MRPILISIVIAIIATLVFFTAADNDDDVIKSIDYIFPLSFWGYILTSLFYIEGNYKRLITISWVMLLVSNLFPFFWKHCENPIDFIAVFSLFLFVVVGLKSVLLYKLSSKIHGFFMIILASIVFLFLILVSYNQILL